MKPVRKLSAWYARQTSMTIDLIVIGLVALPVYLLAVWVQALDRFFELTSHHQNHSLDWIIILLVVLGVAAMFFSARRVIELRREVARRRASERESYRLARHDTLTGLPNRRWFIENFSRWVSHVPEGEACALFIVDLDNFKPINDVYGHRLGDEVLRVIAERMSTIAEHGAVTRLGGDEFGVLMHCRADTDAAARLARRIVYEIQKPIPLAALSLQVGVSVGVAIYDQAGNRNSAMARRDGAEVETVLRQADMAMYCAKSEGRAQYRFFDPAMDQRLQQRVELEGEIEAAIADGQIVPYYQRIVDLGTSETIGFEVLARWEHPTKGLLSPDTFIPIAEDTGTIGELTYALLERAINDAKDWPEHLYLSVNVSPQQITDPSLPLRVLGLLSKSSFAPHRLAIEITENAVVRKLDKAQAVLGSLRDVGVRVALDDFGTGYSGLYHLRELRTRHAQDRPIFCQPNDAQTRGSENCEGDSQPEPIPRFAHHGRRN